MIVYGPADKMKYEIFVEIMNYFRLKTHCGVTWETAIQKDADVLCLVISDKRPVYVSARHIEDVAREIGFDLDTKSSLKIYDAGSDTYRGATQKDIDDMQTTIRILGKFRTDIFDALRNYEKLHIEAFAIKEPS